ncbi:metallophosphoesterase [Myxococcota bacterium]|nr:metallophosphoesterase [Myxococcota bacterium]
MKITTRRATAWLWLALWAWACDAPSAARAARDEAVGHAEAEGLKLDVAGGLAVIQALTPEAITLWAGAPRLTLTLTINTPGPLELTVRNCAPLSWARIEAGWGWVEGGGVEGTQGDWLLWLEEAGVYTIQIAPPDIDEDRAFRFAVLGDIQEAIDDIQDVWAALNGVEGLRFVASTGDLTQRGSRAQLQAIQATLSGLRVPLYTTLGNHELGGALGDWQAIFGRGSFAFDLRQTRFIFLDSGSATLAPKVYEALEGWLSAEGVSQRLAFTHIPLFDPVGVRSGAFRSRREAQRLAARLARGGVNALFHGHIHSYYAYETAGIPTYISGGGGAIPERMDGIGRHALIVDVAPSAPTLKVSILRVD